jgi:hypothetical protein
LAIRPSISDFQRQAHFDRFFKFDGSFGREIQRQYTKIGAPRYDERRSGVPLMGKPIRSTPYEHAFGDETAASLLLGSAYKRAMNVNLHPDGFLVHQLSEVFFGDKPDMGAI